MVLQKVRADSLFEAALRGLCALDSRFWDKSTPSQRHSITVEVHEQPTVHEVPVERLKRWLASGSRNPREQNLKADLRKLFQGTKSV